MTTRTIPVWIWPLAAGLAVLVIVFSGLVIGGRNADMEAGGALARSGMFVSTQGGTLDGRFELVDQAGRTVTNADFEGRAALVYFGFTWCPDVCPYSLQVMEAALSRLDPAARARIRPILISVDPERDTPEQLALYVSTSGFPDDLAGLTGTPEQVGAAARAFGAGYNREGGDREDYLVNHTSFYHLIDAQGELLGFFRPDTPPDEMAAALQDFLDESGA